MTRVNRKGIKVSRQEVRILLIHRGYTVSSLARSIRKSRQWTSKVLYGHISSEPTRRAIARALGIKSSELWPDEEAR